MAGKMSDYRCPQPWDDTKYGGDVYRLGWVKEAIQEGTNYLKLQRAYTMIDKAIDVIGGFDDDPIPKALSDVSTNRLRRQAREVVATLSNLRPIFGYGTENELFQASADTLNKLTMAWWQQTRADRRFKAALQWAAISTGYLSPVWEKSMWVNGRGDIDLKVYGARDILPIQIGRDHNMQKAYAIIICNEVPIVQAHQMYPQFADRLKPDRETPSWYSGMLGRIKNRVRAAYPRHLLDILGGVKEDSSPSGPTVDLYNIYILDPTINRSNHRVWMGKPGTTWHYEVPYIGEELKVVGLQGVSTRMAVEEDCQLYPLRRLMVTTKDSILYDDTSPWWHGMVPILKFCLDEWPDQFLGYSIIHDAYYLQKAINNNMRAYQDYVNKCLRPNIKYPPEGVAKSHINRFDPRVPGQKIPVNMAMGEDIMYDTLPALPVDVLAFDTMMKNEIDHLMAIPDMKALARANQVPSQETFEKLQEIAGPVIQDISRGMEESFIHMGEMVKGLIYQFYRAQRKVSLLGKDGVTEEDFVFEPKMLIPTSMREGEPTEIFPKFAMPGNIEKARRVMHSCMFKITAGSLHQITQTQRKLFLMQFWRDQRFPIDPQTVAEAFDFPNFGELPGSPHTIMDRWKIWTKLQTQVQIETQQAIAQAQMAMQAQMGPPPGAEQPGGGGQPGGQPGPSSSHEGRKPTAEKPPHIVNKDQGSRQTVSES